MRAGVQGCIMSGRQFCLSGPQFPHLCNGHPHPTPPHSFLQVSGRSLWGGGRGAGTGRGGGRPGRQALTLAVLAVLVASHGVHAVAGGAVGGRTVRLRGGQAVSRLDGVRPLAAAGRDGGGGFQAAVQRRDGEVGLGLRRHRAGVAQNAHHLRGESVRVGGASGAPAGASRELRGESVRVGGASAAPGGASRAQGRCQAGLERPSPDCLP